MTKVTQVAAKEATKKGTKDATVHREATNKATMQETTRRKQHERGTKQNKKTREPEQAETTNARSSAPSRRCPGKVPAGTSSSPSLHRC